MYESPRSDSHRELDDFLDEVKREGSELEAAIALMDEAAGSRVEPSLKTRGTTAMVPTVALRMPPHGPTKPVTIRMPLHMISALRHEAGRRGIPYQQLVKLLILENASQWQTHTAAP